MSSNTERAEISRNEAITEWQNQTPTSEKEWVSRAQRVAQILNIDAAERDEKGESPFKEIGLLKAAGFVNLLGPQKYGGGGQTWELAYKIVIEVAKADSSIGHLLGNHYSWFWSAVYFGTDAQREKWIKILTENDSYIGGAVNPRNSDLLAKPDGDDIVFNGKKYFCTGSVVSDHLILEGVLPSGEHVFAYVPGDHPGIKYLHNWNSIGQRLTESGGVVVDNVRVKWEDALGFSPSGDKLVDDVYSTYILPAVQLVFAGVHIGVAIGALETAAGYTRDYTRAWPYGGDNKEKAVDEWYIREGYGALAAKVWGAEALYREVAKLSSDVLHSDRKSLTERRRGEIAVKVAATKILGAETALEVGSKIFELTGARSGLRNFAFDRFWRNVRLHSLHDPLPYKKREVGSFFLLDEIPTPSWYT
ncbi:FMNH2-dependent monooxygenase [Yamadazyma tenuis ATCC 10573]|uniref:FMNH2-dependent monooxygenase n=1 Tax=Candida tenuis (strain ATCC 10573 / BCRC 21748 / CBS 615 / JCM 9827 / NBRC 10315 / NRRL Y-1498 / VKM Y-70) TaxID=590646 RepID=G3BDF1_CANTC|nr:FMNH2-dependent monooxygenase [Yamadazyma tenuis ATCC 10573]EGV60942.1 FMNH2-dependent monooxygenase [Yamadazyma tenuis ATCC 10573]